MHPLNLMYATQTILTQQRCILAFVETTTECSPIMFTTGLFTNIHFYIHFITKISVSIRVPYNRYLNVMRIIEKVAKIGFIECYLVNKLFIFGFDVSKGFHNLLEIIL